MFFLNDGDEHVGGYGAPDLRLDCVLAVAQKLLDTQVLLDPCKNNSTCQRLLYNAAMVKGGKLVLLVKKTKVSWVWGSLKRIRRRCSG